MTKQTCPYSFPLKSRADIAVFLARDGRCYHYTRYRFAWNVKAWGANFDGDSLRKHIPDLDPALDSDWQSDLDAFGDAYFFDWCGDAARWVSGGEWCSYPGEDQGDWDFSFAGRSGGWIVLEKWRGRDMRDVDAADFLDRDLWPWADLVAFYRGIVTADTDFTPENAARAVECGAAYQRETWGEILREQAESDAQAAADAIAESRPDLAPAYA